MNEMKKDKRNRMIVTVLSIPLILIFFVFGPPYYESLSLIGKRVFMPVFAGVILLLLYYVIGERIIEGWVNKNETKIRNTWKAFSDALIDGDDGSIQDYYNLEYSLSFETAMEIIQKALEENGIFEIGE